MILTPFGMLDTTVLQNADRVPLLLVFLCLHLLVGAFLPVRRGQMPLLWHWFGRAGGEMARRLNRADRTVEALHWRGRAVVLIMLSLACVVGAAADRLSGYAFGFLFQLLLLSAGMSAFFPVKVLRAVVKADVPGGGHNGSAAAALRGILSPYHLEDLSALDIHALRRKAIVWAAVMFARGFVVPAVFYLVGGLPVFCMSIAVQGLYAAYANLRRNYAEMVAPVRTLDTLVALVPTVISACLFALAAIFVSRGRPRGALQLAVTASSTYKPWREGLVVAAIAGGLGITLGGPVRYPDGFVAEHGWVGSKGTTAQIATADVQRAALLLLIAFMLFLAFVSGLLLPGL